MRILKKRNKGFTLIELLIVVAILGALAAVAIPNVVRFMGRGEVEASEVELKNIQTAVVSMMVDNQLSTLPIGYVDGTVVPATDNMSKFPHETAACGTVKMNDPEGNFYIVNFDKNGYILYQHDLIGDATQNNLINYVATERTKGTYSVDEDGTVTQETTGYE